VVVALKPVEPGMRHPVHVRDMAPGSLSYLTSDSGKSFVLNGGGGGSRTCRAHPFQ
jgi:hypothetical protein